MPSESVSLGFYHLILFCCQLKLGQDARIYRQTNISPLIPPLKPQLKSKLGGVERHRGCLINLIYRMARHNHFE